MKRREKECIEPRAGDADLGMNDMVWQKEAYLGGSGTGKGAPHEERVTEGNEKADELAKRQEQCWTKD